MWKNEKICSLIHKHLFVFKIRILRGSPIQMMEVSARDQGKSLLVDNNLLFIYFSRYNNKHQDFKFFPLLSFMFFFFRDRDMRIKVILEARIIRQLVLV